jgi:hypothetical protein
VLDTCTLQTLAGRAEREPLLEPPPGVPA